MGLFNFLFNSLNRKTEYFFDPAIFENEKKINIEEEVDVSEIHNDEDDIDYIINELSQIDIDSIIYSDNEGHE